MDLQHKVKKVFGGNRSELWCNGFQAGYEGRDCPPGSDPEFEAGYGRGYEAAEIESANQQWFKDQGVKA